MMKLSNESLRDFDELLKECVESAQRRAKLKRISREHLLEEVADNMRVELDRRKTKLSQLLYNVDMAMNHGADTLSKREIYQILRTQHQPKRLTDDELVRKFVQKNTVGYQVWDQQMHSWVTFSEGSEIHAQITRSPSDNTSVIAVKAYDPTNGKRLGYTNENILYNNGNYLAPPVLNYGYSHNPQHYMEHKDHWFDNLAFGNGAAGTSAGTLEAFFIGQSQYREAWEPLNKTLIDGKWKSKAGNWHHFKDIDLETNGFKKQSLKVSKHWAAQRSAGVNKYSKIAGRLGTVTFIISVELARRNIKNAREKDISNKKKVINKNRFDIAMGIVSFIPPFGWAVSGTYFLMDAEGAFGDFSPSRFTTEEAEVMHDRRQQFASNKLEDVIFEYEFDFEPTPAMKAYEMKEQQMRVSDHTDVAPRTLFKTDFK